MWSVSAAKRATCSYQWAQAYISFEVGTDVMVSRRLEGDFLNYGKAIPETSAPPSLWTETSSCAPWIVCP